MEAELVADLCLVLGLHRYADVMQSFLALIQHFAPPALLHGEHATVLGLMLLLLTLAELLQDKGEQNLTGHIFDVVLRRNDLLEDVPWGIGEKFLGIRVIDIGHDQRFLFLPGHLSQG